MKKINLTQGKVALVDDEDYERVNQYKWCVSYNKKSNTYYAVNHNKGYLHRFILNIQESNIQVDHSNRNGLDNQKHNLRKSTQQQNCFNVPPRNNVTSKYKGVRIHGSNKELFCTSITLQGKEYYLGGYKKEISAAIVYDAIVRYYAGEFAYTNFDKEYIKPLSIEELRKKLKKLTKIIQVIDIYTNKEISLGTGKEICSEYEISKVTLYNRIKKGKNYGNYKFIRVYPKLMIVDKELIIKY